MAAAGDCKSKGFKTVKLNDVKVTGIPQTGAGNPGLVMGAEMFDEPYGNIVLGGKKKSGKTWAIWEIIKKCITPPSTTVYLFVGTVNKDQSWLDIQAGLKRMGVPFTAQTDIGHNGCAVQEIIEDLQAPQEEDEEDDEPETETIVLDDNSEMYQTVVQTKPKAKVKKAPKPKYKPLENLFIFDDLGKALRAQSIGTLVKKNRHFLSKTIISTHDYADLNIDARAQVDYYLLFPQWSEKRLKMVYESMGLSVSFETFLELYNQATAEPHNFLYVRTADDEFRKNFNTKLVVPDGTK